MPKPIRADEKLVGLVSKAIDVAVDSMKSGPRIRAFALCTDDNVSTLYHVASALPLEGPDVLWASPVEWTLEAKVALPHFLKASKLLGARVDQLGDGEMGAHVDASFEALVLALERSKPKLSRITAPGSELLLLATSTDPSPTMQRKLKESAARLNSPELVKRWRRVLFGPRG